MARDFDWYEVVDGTDVQQGDFLPWCPVVVPPPDVQFVPGERPDSITVDIALYNVIIMTQSCDLAAAKIELVLLCPHWPVSVFAEQHPSFRDDNSKEQVRRGNVAGYHMLAECSIPGLEHDVQIVDFRTVYSMPFSYIMGLVSRMPQRLRLLPPYREHLSQAFARFFMRVGLPEDIPPFGRRR